MISSILPPFNTTSIRLDDVDPRIIHHVQEILKLNLNYISTVKIKENYIRPLIRNHKSNLVDIKQNIFRVRPLPDIFWFPKDLSYPSMDIVKKYKIVNRINDDQSTMFYGAFHPKSAIDETIPRGKPCLFTISEWKKKRPFRLYPAGFSEASFSTMKSLYVHSQNFQNKQFGFNDMTNKFIEGFLGYLLTLPSSKIFYKLSIAYSQIILEMENVDGILYPTVSNSGKGLNVALKESAADNDLELINANQITYTNESPGSLKRNDSFQIHGFLHSFDEKGSIIWAGSTGKRSNKGLVVTPGSPMKLVANTELKWVPEIDPSFEKNMNKRNVFRNFGSFNIS